jgi:hypothetical protein
VAKRSKRAGGFRVSGVQGAQGWRVEGPEDLWWAEGRWWQRIDRDATVTLRVGRAGPTVMAAAAARLVADAWRAQAALEAGHGAGQGWRRSMPWREGLVPQRMAGSRWSRRRRDGGACWPRSQMPVW